MFQARGPGRRRWHTFRRAETDGQGRFAARYRFRRTTDSTTYRIRAVVPAQSGYPYREGALEARRVRVIGPVSPPACVLRKCGVAAEAAPDQDSSTAREPLRTTLAA